MTYLELQNAVMLRLNWTSTDARALVKEWLNRRYREVCSSVNVAATRRGFITFTTVSDNRYITATGIAALRALYDPVTRKLPLDDTTVDDIMSRDPDGGDSGTPTHYAIHEHVNDEITILVYPKPDAVIALTGDALLAGTDMSADGDEPSIPDDFHDILIKGAMADAQEKLEKTKLAERAEEKFEKRLSELRYFLRKRAHLAQPAQDSVNPTSGRKTWPYSNLAT